MARLLRSGLTVATIVGGVLLGLVFAGAASAAPRCVIDCPTLFVNTARPAAGDALTVRGEDFGGFDRVDLTLPGATNPLGSVHTNALGTFRTTLTLPSHLAGRRPIVASDAITDQRVRQVLRIGASNGAGFGRAYRAGRARSAAYERVAIIGLGALAVVLLTGGGLLLLTRRQQQISV